MNDRNSNDEPKNFSFSDLMIENRLGRGSTSHVFKTQSIRTKKNYAMKVIDKMSSDYKQSDFLKQIRIHQSLQHQHICHFVKHFEDEYNHYIVTEYCRDGEITKFLLSPLNEQKILDILQQLSLAINYMHNQVGIAHCDLKLGNILINGPHLKICDFGFSVNLASRQQKNSAFGTLMYMSPQILINNCNKHHKQADVWALGICILTLMLQQKPYTMETSSGLKNQIINGSYIKLTKENFPKFSQQLLSLVGSMLQFDYKKRVKIEKIVDDPIFKRGTVCMIQNNRNKKKINVLEVREQFGQKSQEDDDRGTEKQKEDESKSIGNITFDTTDIDTVDSSPVSQNLRMWSYCLQPQVRSTGVDGFIEIQSNRSIKVKIRKIEFVICPEGSFLEVTSGMKYTKMYTLKQIIQNPKIHNLYIYAGELIDMIKKKQCQKQEIIDGKYFWMSKKTIGCLISKEAIIQKNFQSCEMKETCLSGSERVVDGDEKQMERVIFEKGEKSLLSKIRLELK